MENLVFLGLVVGLVAGVISIATGIQQLAQNWTVWQHKKKNKQGGRLSQTALEEVQVNVSQPQELTTDK